MHTCPTHLCDKQVEDDKLMCRSHWYELPWQDRDAVWNSFHQHGPGAEHIREITPILERQKNRLYPPRNQGKPFGL